MVRKIQFPKENHCSDVEKGLDGAPNSIYPPPLVRIWFTLLQFGYRQLRISNLFLLFIAIIEAICSDELHKKYLSFAPLGVIFCLNFVLAFQELRKLMKWEKGMNERNESFQIIDLVKRQLRQDTKYLEDLDVGDVIYLEPNDSTTKEVYVPADVVLLGVQCQCHNVESGKTCGRCYISTQHLNGDTEVITKQGHPTLMNRNNIDHLNYTGELVYDEPEEGLHQFSAKFIGKFVGSKTEELNFNNTNFIPRGSTMFHAQSVICLVVYVGQETKIGKMMDSKINVKRRSISDLALDKCFLSMIYLLGFLTLLLTCIFYSELNLGSSSLFYGVIIDPTQETFQTNHFGNVLIQSFVELQYILPVTLLITIEILRILQAWKIEKDPKLTASMFANPHFTDDLGKVSHVVLDGKAIITTKEIEVKSLSVPYESYKVDIALLKGVLASSDCSSERLHQLLISIVLISNSTSLTIQERNAEDSAFLDMAEQLGYVATIHNDSQTQSLNLLDLTYEVVEILSSHSKDSVMNGIITKTMQQNKDIYSYFIKGTRSQLEEYMDMSLTAGVTDFTHRGMSTSYFASGVLINSEVELLLNYSKPQRQVARLTWVEKNQELFKLKPQNMQMVGSVGMRNKVNLKCKDLFRDFRSAGLKTIILSQNAQECIKASCVEAGILTGDKMDQLLKFENLNSMIKAKTDRKVNCIIVNGNTFAENTLRIPFLLETLSQHYDRIVVSGMTSRLKKQIVEGLLSQLKRKDPRLKQRLLNVVWPFSQKRREAVLVIGNSAHDVQMIQVADLSIYFNSEDSEETFEDARTYGNFNASSFQDLRRLVLVYGIQNSFSVSKVSFFILYSNFLRISIQFLIWIFLEKNMSTSVFESFDFFCFNILIGVLGLVIGRFEQVYSADDIMKKPDLYRHRGNEVDSSATLFLWLLSGFIHSFFIVLCFATLENGFVNDRLTGGSELTFRIFLILAIKIAVTEPNIIPTNRFFNPKFEFNKITTVVAVSLPLLYILKLAVYFAFQGQLAVASNSEGLADISGNLIFNPLFWWVSLFTAGICTIADSVYKGVKQILWIKSEDL